MADDFGERTEDATPKRRHEARNEGNVARSQDLAGALLLLGGTIGLWLSMSPLLLGLQRMMLGSFDPTELTQPLDPAGASQLLLNVSGQALMVAAPVIAIVWIVACGAHMAQFGWLFSLSTLAPRWNKLNPMTGFSRIFGTSALIKAMLDVLKVSIVVAVAVHAVMQDRDEILVLPYLELWPGMISTGYLILNLALRVLAVLLILGILDFLYQKWKHSRDLRMTKQQIKDEMKQSDGDPEVKRRRIRMQQQIAMQRISAAVPKADVIVTNPEHISVAIAYDQAKMNAPRVVAKGADFLAMRIRQLAMQHGVPIIERKPLARALYAQVKVGREIPPEFYQAVAEILAYVYRLGGRKVA